MAAAMMSGGTSLSCGAFEQKRESVGLGWKWRDSLVPPVGPVNSQDQKLANFRVRLGNWCSVGCIELPQLQHKLVRTQFPQLRHQLVRIPTSCRVSDNCRGDAETESSDEADFSNSTKKDVKIDLKLPRRRLLVEFTCNVCQARTQRLINPEAYKRGTVYVQCGGCEAYHQLVDNLGLVVEYDFRKEADPSN